MLSLVSQMASAHVPVAFSHAVAVRGCTQEDAPALEIYLTQRPFDGQGMPPKPYLHIEVAGTDWQPLVGRPLKLIPLSREGVDPQTTIVRAELDRGERSAQIFLAGTLRIKSAQPDRPVEGHYDFGTHAGQRWAGTFRAAWQETRGSGCGG